MLDWLVDPVSHLCAHPYFKLLSIKTIPGLVIASLLFQVLLILCEIFLFLKDAPSVRAFQHLSMVGVAEELAPDVNHRCEARRRNELDHDSPRYQNLLTTRRKAHKKGYGGLGLNLKCLLSDRAINRSISNLLFLRGIEANKADFSQLMNPNLYVPWARDPLRVCVSHSKFNKYDRTATLLSNSQAVVKPLNKVVSKACEMYLSRAFLHHYNKHGISEGDFEDVRVDFRFISYFFFGFVC
jgi:hypothetical protein